MDLRPLTGGKGGGAQGRKGKQSFFEKKDQKTFISSPIGQVCAISTGEFGRTASKTKVFWSFFSKKDCLPRLMSTYDSSRAEQQSRR
jgi:hypothetical protein